MTKLAAQTVESAQINRKTFSQTVHSAPRAWAIFRKLRPTWGLPTTQSLFVLVFVIVIVIEARTPRCSHSTNHYASIGCV